MGFLDAALNVKEGRVVVLNVVLFYNVGIQMAYLDYWDLWNHLFYNATPLNTHLNL